MAAADRDHVQEVGTAEVAGRTRHRHGGDDARAGDQAEGRRTGVPEEPATDRAAQLQHVTDLGHVGEELRDLTARQLSTRNSTSGSSSWEATEYERCAV